MFTQTKNEQKSYHNSYEREKTKITTEQSSFLMYASTSTPNHIKTYIYKQGIGQIYLNIQP